MLFFQHDGLDRQWDRSHVASARAEVGELLLHDAQLSQTCHKIPVRSGDLKVSSVSFIQDAGNDEVQTSKYNNKPTSESHHTHL